MPVSVADLRAHVRYTAWATDRLLKAAAQLTPEELTADHGSANKSVLDTLAHVFGADRLWLSRVVGAPRTSFLDDGESQFETLQNAWPAVLDRWDAHLAAQSDASAGGDVQYTSLAGKPFRTPLWQIVLHVVNHGTHHRGQVSGFLRRMGYVPPPLDLIAYYWEQTSKD